MGRENNDNSAMLRDAWVAQSEKSKTMTRDQSPKVNIFMKKSYFQNKSSVF